jgi:hypothetical protein
MGLFKKFLSMVFDKHARKEENKAAAKELGSLGAAN